MSFESWNGIHGDSMFISITEQNIFLITLCEKFQIEVKKQNKTILQDSKIRIIQFKKYYFYIENNFLSSW